MQRKYGAIIVVLFLIMLLMINNSYSKYKTLVVRNGNAIIAEPIILIEKDNVITKEYNKKSGVIEYYFKIKNYDSEKINEVDCLYNIEILENNQNFPIEYKLIDLSNNQEITINNNKSIEFLIGSSIKEEDAYKLELRWKDKEINQYSNSLQISLKANIVQRYS